LGLEDREGALSFPRRLLVCLPAGIAAQQSVSQVPVYLAAQLRFYEHNGVDVELPEFAGASKGMEALLGGSVDVLSGYYTQVLQVERRGRKFEVLLPIYDSLLVALAVSPAHNDRIRTIADLRGAKVGVTTLGSATHQFLDYLLRKNGLSPADVTPIAIGTASRGAAAMERGIVDAGIVTDFTIRYLERRFGPVHLLADTRTRAGTLTVHGTDAFPGTVLIAAPDWLKHNKESSERLVRSVSQAMDWMRAHTPDEIAAKMPPSHYGEDKEAYLISLRFSIPMLSRASRITEAGHKAALEMAAPGIQ
jgi:sulfonate transport system substrate-binding protein